MHDTFDQETGEVAETPVSERAVAAGKTERQARRDEIRGVGLVSIYGKLASAYRKLKPIIGYNKLAKDKTGQRGDYTSYDRIIKIVQPVLLEAGIIIRHGTGFVLQLGEAASKTYWLPVNTYLIDVESGDVLETTIPIPIVRPDPHSIGSAVQYGKRYGILSALGFATGDESEDDDAQSAMPRNVSDESEADEIVRDILSTTTEDEANKLKAAYYKRIQGLDEEGYERVKVAFQAHVKKLRETPADPAPAKKGKKAEAAA